MLPYAHVHMLRYSFSMAILRTLRTYNANKITHLADGLLSKLLLASISDNYTVTYHAVHTVGAHQGIS